ncbi:MAG TPA: DEAD/DEAH box helicase [Nitrosomonas sp.]|nr:DEAD/DEAH box helicase [Nitrosomonas sp.]
MTINHVNNAIERCPTTWKIADDHLEYVQEDGIPIKPTAEEIWDSLYGNGSRFSCTPDVVLSEYTFSRFPAEPGLLLTGKSPDTIRLDLIGKIGSEYALIGPNTDQLFIGKTWYPLALSDYEDVFTLLRKQNILLGQPITVGQLIWLKTHVNIGIELIDNLESGTPAEIQAPPTLNANQWGLNAELYGYQKDGVHFLCLIANQGLGCILGDEMGLGKTVQVIALMLAEHSAGRLPSLVVAPATLLENWRRELTQFAPSLSISIHAGPNRAGIISRLEGFDVVVTSYDIAVRDEPMLSSIRWNLLALDEAQNIKNPDAQRTIAVKRLPRRVSLAVTGTPVENKLTDLWSLSDFSLPGLLGERGDFESLFENTASDASQLAPLVAPILLRRRVKEVAKDLPERIDIPQPIGMSKSMAELYEQVRLSAINEYGKSAALVALQRLRMFCSHPRLAGYDSPDPAVHMPKYQRLIELLEEIFSQNEKCLIFTSYNGMTDIFLQDLPMRFKEQYFNFIDGRVAVANRQIIVDDFSASSCGGVLILNPRAAGVGLNITSANHVIHYNPEWNPALEDQASARAYRRKQQRPVTIHQLYFVDSVEEVIVERLGLKRSLAEHAATGHQGDATANDVMRALTVSPLSGIVGLE